MKLYDSLTKDIREIDDKEINIYNCGPTVYNDIHIGNARPLIIFDVLYRFLKAQGFKVNYLHNLTDIDDKIIKAALEKGIPELELSNYYANAYKDIRKKLNTLDMKIEKVSDNIDGIIQYISRMIDNKGAYVVNGNVYFNTMSIKNYGILSNRQLDEQIHGERVSEDDSKLNKTDFVLWKKTNEGIQWNTPWSKGRPGWHTECSFLIEKYFGKNLTIHGGGIDLKFPHHENENAQHNCLHKQNLAKIWMHIGHININQEKMSKSANNFILMKDLLSKIDYRSIRWFMYQTNYHNPLDFNNELIDNCTKEIEKIKLLINSTKTILIGNDSYKYDKQQYNNEFIKNLNNNLNITNGLTNIHEMSKQINIQIRSKKFNETNQLLNELLSSLWILGIEFDNIHSKENIDLIKQYYFELKNKNFDKSDLIRKTLIEKGLL